LVKFSNFNLFLKNINLPKQSSHKGQNGKLLVIGGSKLFHSSIFWAADVASRVVDMVHFTSPENENNELVRKKLKDQLWTGIVVDWTEVEGYVKEDDVVLIGPGMERSTQTKKIVNYLLKTFPNKKWVVDGGALQMVNPQLLGKNVIITPHSDELRRLLDQGVTIKQLLDQKVIILAKGQVDHVYQDSQVIEIVGGNPGLTKGGTGDVLAGLVAALYCHHDSLTAAVVASLVNKKAGEVLWQTAGPYFNASDLVAQVPKTLWRYLSPAS